MKSQRRSRRAYLDDTHHRELIIRGAMCALGARARSIDGLHRLVFNASRTTDTTRREALSSCSSHFRRAFQE
jgi:hypothetical protein